MIILWLIYLISVYFHRFGKQNVDLFIVASFIILGLAVLDRCAINFTNYYFAFDFFQWRQMGTNGTVRYEDWYQANHYGMLEVSSVMFAYAIGLRKISLFINIARWFVTIERFKDMQNLS